jgi:HK97 gp10 family phage protein
MSNPVTIVVSGEKELARRIRALPDDVRNKVLKRAAREAMKPALAVARRNSPKKTGLLRKSLKSKAQRNKLRGWVGQIIETREGWFGGETFYGAFQEFGWHVGKRRNSLRSRGEWGGIGGPQDNRKFVEGKHFVEKTFDTEKEAIASRFIARCRYYLANGLPQDRRGAHLRSGGGTK